MSTPAPLRIGNCSGFYGDRISAAREMVRGGEIDVLVGDYLAELTMYILWKSKSAGKPGYAGTFLRQMEEVLAECVERGIRIVVNAGGLDPEGLAKALEELGASQGVSPRIAYITGDDLLGRIDEITAEGVDFENIDTGELLADAECPPATANAYLGGRAIARALAQGADIVICPRVTDASLVVGPAMWHFGWSDDAYDQIAGSVAAGHVIECGAQATGGNYSFFKEIDNPVRPGFPIAEIAADGSSVITKHDGTGGLVSVGTVTAQLVYEVQGRHYLNTDVTLDLASIRLSQIGKDRVEISGVRGYAPPPTVKVAISCPGTYNQSVTFAIPGEDVEEKAALAQVGILDALGGEAQFDRVAFRLVRADHPDATVNELAVAKLVATFSSYDKTKLGRRIFDAAISLALSTYPGVYFQDQSQRPTQAGVNWPALVPQSLISEKVVFLDGETIDVAPHADFAIAHSAADAESVVADRGDDVDLVEVSVGTLFGTRSGDKGANANVGMWARTDEAYAWLETHLETEGFRALLPEAYDLQISRTALPNLRAVNFVVHGLLGDGAASGARFDPQAKGLGEFIRSRRISVPRSLIRAAEKTEKTEKVAA